MQLHMWDQEKHYSTEYAQDDIVVDSHISKVKRHVQQASEQRKEQGGSNECHQLLLDIGDFSLVLVLLVLSLFIEVVERESHFVYGAGKCQLAPTVIVQLCVDLVNDDVQLLRLGALYHVSINQLEGSLDCCVCDLVIQRLELRDTEYLVDVFEFFESQFTFDLCVPVKQISPVAPKNLFHGV